MRDLSIVDWQFRAVLAIGLVAVLGSSWLLIRRRRYRWAARAVSVPFLVAFIAATVNAHYDYFPTLGTLLGRTATDQISAGDFLRLEHSYLNTFRGTYHLGRNVPNTRPGSLPVHGVVVSFLMPGSQSHFPARTGLVYLPPVWFESPHPHLPVIELLHGSPGSPPDWTRASAADLTADTYAQTHGGYAPILVMPDVNGGGWRRDSECVNGPRGNAEIYLTVDVRNALGRAFGARTEGAAWAVAGLSEGGTCALQMGLRHPDLFHVVGDYSGDDHPWVTGGPKRLFWGTTPAQLADAEAAYDPRLLLAHWHSSDPPAIIFACGRSDRTLPKMQHLIGLARHDHIETTLVVLAGGHTFRLWKQSFAHTMPWITQHLSTTH